MLSLSTKRYHKIAARNNNIVVCVCDCVCVCMCTFIVQFANACIVCKAAHMYCFDRTKFVDNWNQDVALSVSQMPGTAILDFKFMCLPNCPLTVRQDLSDSLEFKGCLKKTCNILTTKNDIKSCIGRLHVLRKTNCILLGKGALPAMYFSILLAMKPHRAHCW